ncbi:MAG: hypothetical protein ABI467_22790, partial [Kofleriaceae bacterium]
MVAFIAMAAPGTARAQPVDAGTPAPDAAQVSVRAVDPATTATQIRAFMAGTLDATVDPRSLFVIDLASSIDARSLAATLDHAKRPRGTGSASESPARMLVDARAAFFALTDAQRAKLFEQHAAARAASLAGSTEQLAHQHLLAELRDHVTKLRAFLAGTLDPGIDPRPLLRIDLASEAEVALSADRRTAFLAVVNGTPAPPGRGSAAGSAAGSGSGSGAPLDL